jgi:hypothetical protein
MFAVDRHDHSNASKPFMKDSNAHPECENTGQVLMEHRFMAEEDIGTWTACTHFDEPIDSNNYCDPFYSSFPVQTQDSLFAQSVISDQPTVFPERRMDPLLLQDCTNNSMRMTPFNYVESDCSASIAAHSIQSSSGSCGSANSRNVAGTSNFAHANKSSFSQSSFSSAALFQHALLQRWA